LREREREAAAGQHGGEVAEQLRAPYIQLWRAAGRRGGEVAGGRRRRRRRRRRRVQQRAAGVEIRRAKRVGK
jgi:hypothetical protein